MQFVITAIRQAVDVLLPHWICVPLPEIYIFSLCDQFNRMPILGLNGATKKDTSSNYENPRVCTIYNLHFSLSLASRAMLLNPADEADGAAQLNGFCRINTLALSFVFDIYPWITIINGKQLVTGFGIYAEISVIFRYTNI